MDILKSNIDRFNDLTAPEKRAHFVGALAAFSGVAVTGLIILNTLPDDFSWQAIKESTISASP